MKIIAFDTEDNSKGVAFLYNFYDVEQNKHHTFTDQLDALDFALSKSRHTFWACNLEYDVNNLFRGHYGLLQYTYATSRLLSCDVIDELGKKSDKIRFFDTMNHWMFSVKDMGARINMPKFEMKHDGESIATPKMVEYCRRDTEIVGRFVKQMASVYRNIGCELKMTIASTTLNFFENNYYGRKIMHPFTEEQIDFFHEGYYGGRTEIFFNKPISGRIFYHDINSMYSSAMLNRFPRLEYSYETSAPNFDHEGMARVRVTAPDIEIPYLPKRHDGKLIFPLGTFEGVYTYFEIRKAVKLGYKIDKVMRAVEFLGYESPYVSFVNDMYKNRIRAKKQKDGLMDLAYKNLMNMLYGKFATGNEFIKLKPIRMGELKSGDVLFNDLVLSKEKGKYPRYANCIWACYVTAYARDALWNTLQAVSLKKGLLLYCDTDSIIYENEKSLIKDSKKMGEFKLEGVFKYAHFKLPKLYTLVSETDEQTYKTRGVPRSASKDFFETGSARFKKPYKLREALRRNLAPKNKVKLIPNFWEFREKSTRQVYNKRRVLKSGHTVPLILSSKRESPRARALTV